MEDAAARQKQLTETERAIRGLRQSVTDAKRRAAGLTRAAAQLKDLHPADGPAQIRALITARQTNDDAVARQHARTENAQVLRDHLDALGIEATATGAAWIAATPSGPPIPRERPGR